MIPRSWRSSAARSSGPRTSGSRLVSLAIAIALAFALLVATRQITLHGWYDEHYAYRAQVDALLSGRLALSPSPDALLHDLAWTPSGVQQVWGLGVPILQAPFEALARAVGLGPFPDRIAMLAFIALAFFMLLRAFRGWVGIGAMLLTGLLPALVTMMRCRMQVYEGAAIYAYLAALILVAGVVILARAPSRWRYLALLAAAGATGLIRPTVWFYGLATAIAASVIWWRAGGRKSIAAGALLFLLGGGALYATNAMRFGKGSEFGHRLNIESLSGNLTATRFSYPFERVGTLEATEELFGSLFDRPEQASRGGWYQKDLHVGQSEVVRWREYYFTTYSWPYLPLLLAGLVLGALAFRRRDGTGALLVAWAIAGAAPLVVFYLHSPAVSSRYQLDLAPAFAVLLLLGWRELVARVDRRIALAIVGVLWATAVITSKTHRPSRGSDPVDSEEALSAYEASRPLPGEHAIPDGLEIDDPMVSAMTDAQTVFERCMDESDARISCAGRRIGGDRHYEGVKIDLRWYVKRSVIVENGDTCPPTPEVFEELESATSNPLLYLDGFGWRLDGNASVPVATLFYVSDPRFFEVELLAGDPEKVRVAIGLVHLERVAIASTTRGVRVRFEAREPLPAGLAVAFLAFGDDDNLDHKRSDYELAAVRWR